MQLSPTYCTNCITSSTSIPAPVALECPIEIPRLEATPFLPMGCNLAAYVSHTLSFELTNIERLTASYLDGLGAETLPEINEWLAMHVHENSFAYQRL